MFSCGDDCGPFDDLRQRATEIRGNFVSLESSEDSFTVTPLFEDEKPFDNLAFQVNAEFEPVMGSQISSNSWAWSFLDKAYACTPPPPSTDDKIVNIEITADKKFNENFPIGSNLSEFFDLVEFDAFLELFTSRIDAISFFESEPQIPFQMTLVLNEAPTTNEPIIFRVKLLLDSENLESYTFESNPIRVTSNN